jgi:hypothetical protein
MEFWIFIVFLTLPLVVGLLATMARGGKRTDRLPYRSPSIRQMNPSELTNEQQKWVKEVSNGALP